MNAPTGQRSFGFAVVPACPPRRILVEVSTRNLKLADLGKNLIAFVIDRQGEDQYYIGTVVAVGTDVADRSFRIGDAVISLDSGKCIDTLDGRKEGVEPKKLWRIPAAVAKEFGVAFLP
ncbi:hypothetical protein FRB97_004240 [Tulasnella sp. 331]|nr:hypothetical protein FRB97_004240 [Tulasnella sp. 331]